MAFSSSSLDYGSTLTAVHSVLDGREVDLGIDEAGRGPVVGPMVYAACYLATSDLEEFKSRGYDDSKQLKESVREEMFNGLRSAAATGNIGYVIHSISALEISANMLKKQKLSLNVLSHNSARALIEQTLEKGVNVKRVFVDTVGDPEVYQRKLHRYFPDLEIVVAKKADSLFPVVSAASILAKVTRDREVSRLINHGSSWDEGEALWCILMSNQEDSQNVKNQKDGLEPSHPISESDSSRKRYLDIGSGYPADSRTQHFVKSRIHPVFGLPRLVRSSWGTVAELCGETEQDPERPILRLSWFTEDSQGISEENDYFRPVKKGRQCSLASFLGGIRTGSKSKLFGKRKLSLAAEGL